MLKITKRAMTLPDFLKLKKFQPFADQRQLSKTINFSLIFGCSALRFSQELKENMSDAEIEGIIRDLNLGKRVDQLRERQIERGKPMPEKDLQFLAAAEFMRTAFFKTYKGLMGRINREYGFTKEHGYTRSYHGPVRHNPILTMLLFDDKGRLTGGDKEFGLLHSNLKNISVNTTVQSMEAFIVMNSIHQINEYLTKRWKLKSFIFNTVHDSIDFCLYDEEIDLVLSLVNEICCKIREPFEDIPMCIDAEVSDLRDPKQYYKHGKEWDIKPLEESLKEYNEKHGTELWYEPIGL
jgi:DNA polymerase I-like protein with 3'-5' exonuclease and polymerase domains